jgi:hypothetical protein
VDDNGGWSIVKPALLQGNTKGGTVSIPFDVDCDGQMILDPKTCVVVLQSYVPSKYLIQAVY